MSITLHHGDCREVLATLLADSVDACVTDPPYALTEMSKRWAKTKAGDRMPGAPPFNRHTAGFMGKTWDNGAVAFDPETWEAVLRVLKPGGHLVAFGGTRTFHRLTCAIEDAGFEIRDCLSWLYGSGFPKSLDVSKAIDKAAGAEREATREATRSGTAISWDQRASGDRARFDLAATDAAQPWQGWGTALKPAWEPIILARKPLSERSVAANVLRHGTGAVNVDGCRIGDELRVNPAAGNGMDGSSAALGGGWPPDATPRVASGRWPANVVLDEEAAAMLDEQSGEVNPEHRTSVARNGRRQMEGWRLNGEQRGRLYPGNGGASRFFYTAKADTQERMDGMAKRSSHPTVKPLALMVWLVKLVTPPGGVVLDPFLGSGTTAIACVGNGFSCIGIEREAEYVEEARQRIGLGCVVVVP